MNLQCRKCGETVLVISRALHNVRIGLHWTAAFPFIAFGPYLVRAGFLAQCTRHGCGRGWVATARGMDDPGIGEPRVVAQPRGRERDEDEERQPPELGVIERPDV